MLISASVAPAIPVHNSTSSCVTPANVKFDAVLVWKLDGFGRSLKHLVNALADLATLGVAFIALRDNLSTPSGRLMFHVIGAMCEFERELIRERVRARIANARAKGKRLGRRRSAGRRCQCRSAALRGPHVGRGMRQAQLVKRDCSEGRAECG
jgi:DNA invertase Pin-like site-specific DNA recombinase